MKYIFAVGERVVKVKALGPVRVIADGDSGLSPLGQRVLALLVAASEHGISTDRCAEELWGDRIPKSANNSIRNQMAGLRRHLGKPAITKVNGRYVLVLPRAAVDVWELADLAHHSEEASSLAPEKLCSLLDGRPFPDLEVSRLIRVGIDTVHANRLALIAALGTSESAGLDPRLQASIRTLVEENREDEQLRDAASHLFEANGLAPAGPALLTGEAMPDSLKHAPLLSPAIGHLAAKSMHGRASSLGELETLLAANPAGILITGESGIGKTRIAAELALRAHRDGAHVMYLSSSAQVQGTYAPFLQACPALRSAFVDSSAKLAFARSRLWVGALATLQTEYPERRLLIVADDVQWFDSQSLNLLEFIARSVTDPPIKLLVAGRRSGTDQAPSWFDDLDSAGLASIQIPGLDTSALRALVAEIHPGAPTRLRADLAGYLSSSGVTSPEHARQLIRAADSTTLSLDTLTFDQPEIWLTDSNEVARSVASVATVLGTIFTVDELAQLSEIEAGTVQDAVDHLIESDVFSLAGDEGRYRFRHLLARVAYGSCLAKPQERRLHRRLFHLASDPVAKAEHGRHAGALVNPDDVFDATLAAARIQLEAGSYREAIGAFRRASRLRDQLPIEDEIKYATALECSGGDGRRVRANAFIRAFQNGEPKLALAAAMAGEFSSERVDGDPYQIRLLEQLGTIALNEEENFARLVALGRQYGLIGQHGDAMACVSDAIALADDSDALFSAWLAGWPTAMRLAPSAWHPQATDPNTIKNDQLRGRFWEIRTLRGLINGDSCEADRALSEWRSIGEQIDPIRQWHIHLADSTMAFLDGRLVEADHTANQAFDFGQRHALRNCFGVRSAQLFLRYWVAGRHSELLPFLKGAGSEVQDTLLTRAAIVSARSACGQDEAAAGSAAALATEVHESESPYAPAVVALVADAIDGQRHPDALERAFATLELVRDAHIIVGAGVGSLGPASHALSKLTVDQDHRSELLEESVQHADRCRLRTWQVAYRLELAEIAGRPRLVTEATEIAGDSDLRTLLTGHESSPGLTQ